MNFNELGLDFATAEKLPRSFYARPVLRVAPELLGQIIVHRRSQGVLAARIVEVEAYRGPEDRAAHSFGGRRTRRTEVMFGPAGHAYLFLLYGQHWNFNIVTGQPEQPQAVLIRAVEPVVGLSQMARRRGRRRDDPALTNGPGKLCQALALDGSHYGVDLCQEDLFLVAGPKLRARRSPRIGIDYAGAWANKPWRFFAPDCPFVSRGRGGPKAP